VSRRRLLPVVVFLVALALTAAAYFLSVTPPADPAWPEIWSMRVVRGVVLAGGAPVRGAIVEYYPDPDKPGARGEPPFVKADANGRFTFDWRPTRGEAPYLRARDPEGEFAPTVVRAGAGVTTIQLVPRTTASGRVLDHVGNPLAGVRILVAPRGGLEVRETTSGESGLFRLEGLPRGQRIDVLVVGDGLEPYFERRYRGGDEIHPHLGKGTPLRVTVTDPDGRPLEARLTLPLPRAFSGRDLPLSAGPSGALLRVTAPGFLPVETEVVSHRPTSVILWPERTVDLRVADGVRRRGVPRIRIAPQIRPADPEAWRVGLTGSALRRFPLRAGDKGGLYHARLPRCPLTLLLTAPGYADAELSLGEDENAATVWMRPLSRGVGGTLEFVASGAPDGFPLVVADATGRWHRVIEMDRGRAQLEVPPETLVQIASLGAYEGLWLPKVDRAAPPRGGRDRVVLGLHPATRIAFDVTPPVDGLVTLTDRTYKALKRPRRARLEKGKAVLWGRPKRDVEIEVRPDSNHFPVTFDLFIEDEATDWPVKLRPAAGIAAMVRDGSGHPVPFAAVHVWEPDRAGRLELRARPRTALTEPTGRFRITGLRRGTAALTVRSPGFRTILLSPLDLSEGELTDRSVLTLKPAGRFRGIVQDYAGRPVGGVWLRVLEPKLRRLPLPGGGERDLYDLTEDDNGDAATDEQGRFEIPDPSSRAPLIACYPAGRPDIAPAVFEPADTLTLTGNAFVELDVRASIQGVYQLLPEGRAVLIAIDPPIALRPLPLELPAGDVRLFIRLRNHHWAAVDLTGLKRGESVRITPEFQPPR
jgi:hypothetical protein